MEVIIRDITNEDYQDVCILMNNDLELGLNVTNDIISTQIERMKCSGNYIIKAAEYENQIVGFIAAYKTLILEIPNEYMRIIGLSVKKQYRRMSIGTQLMSSLTQYANEHDIAYIALNTLPGATADHAFYQANGFEKKSVCYSKVLRTTN